MGALRKPVHRLQSAHLRGVLLGVFAAGVCAWLSPPLRAQGPSAATAPVSGVRAASSEDGSMRPGAGKDPLSVPALPPLTDRLQTFHDQAFGVSFDVPEGWQFSREDDELSDFHKDAGRWAPDGAQVRGVAMLDFNPYPLSTFSGAMFYYTVARGVKKRDCLQQALGRDAQGLPGSDKPDEQEVGGRSFAHGHDEHGRICVEARDEVYTAYRRGSCYRFDLEVNTFCSVSSGAEDLSGQQIVLIEDRMDTILRSVRFKWGKSAGSSGAQPIAPGKPTPPELVRPVSPEPVLRHAGA